MPKILRNYGQGAPFSLPDGDTWYAPTQENYGLIALFFRVFPWFSKRYGWRYQGCTGAQWPDAYFRDSSGQLIGVVFEINCSSAKKHLEQKEYIDYVVCWKEDWPDAASYFSVINLRKALEGSRQERGDATEVSGKVVSSVHVDKEASTPSAGKEGKAQSKDTQLLAELTMPCRNILRAFQRALAANKEWLYTQEIDGFLPERCQLKKAKSRPLRKLEDLGLVTSKIAGSSFKKRTMISPDSKIVRFTERGRLYRADPERLRRMIPELDGGEEFEEL